MAGDGKSKCVMPSPRPLTARYDQITFTGINEAFFNGYAFDFEYIVSF